MLYSLRKLLVVRVHRWPESTQFDAVLFRRTWWNLVLQPNDSFAARLMDTLWCARHGQLGPLRRILAQEEEAGNFLQLCSALQDVAGRDDDAGDDRSSLSSRGRDRQLTPTSETELAQRK
mmetsp:Transcript_79631/g.209156  ORF Transcript_79631/g.209156 Transcript_79631/m.209156 type:complete len:120 (+) Transcript_79631:50-409(+)